MKKILFKNKGIELSEESTDSNFVFLNEIRIPYEDWLQIKDREGSWEKIIKTPSNALIAEALEKIKNRKILSNKVRNDKLKRILRILWVESFGSVEDTDYIQCLNYIKSLPTIKQQECLEELDRLFN